MYVHTYNDKNTVGVSFMRALVGWLYSMANQIVTKPGLSVCTYLQGLKVRNFMSASHVHEVSAD